MKNKSFIPLETTVQLGKRKRFLTGLTLIEIFVGLIILAILASISMASFRKTIETNKEKICSENLKVLQAAIDIYTLENNSLPASLARLSPRQIYLAYAQIVGEPKENSLLGALRNILGIKPALAQSLARYYAANRNVFGCPADTAFVAPGAGGCAIGGLGTYSCGSYTFNFENNRTFDNSIQRLRRLNAQALIYDSSARHSGQMRGITPGGIAGKASTTGGDTRVNRAVAKGVNGDNDISQTSYEQLKTEKED